MPDRDALLVECTACGAPCSAAKAETVVCDHCGATVVVDQAVRIFASHVEATGAGHVWTARLEQLRALRDGLALPRDEDVDGPEAPRAEQLCPSCGKPLSYGAAPLEKCPHCGTESVPQLREGVQMSVAALLERAELRRKIREQMLEMFPLALEPETANGDWRCSRCQAALQADGIDPLGKPRFRRCTECFTLSYGSEPQSTLAMYTAIAASLPSSEPAPIPDASAPVGARRRLKALLGLLILLVAVLAIRLALQPNVRHRPPLVMPTVPTFQALPRFTSFPDAQPGDCERLLSRDGECVDNGSTARRCSDAGTVQHDNCYVLGMRCARDLCATGARCCPIGWSAAPDADAHTDAP